jgi:TolA-binding protein
MTHSPAITDVARRREAASFAGWEDASTAGPRAARGSILAALVAAFVVLSGTWLRADPAADQFAVGAAHYLNRRWDLAVDEFQQFRRRFPAHPKAAAAEFFCAESLLQSRRYQEARDLYRRFVEQYPDDAHGHQAEFRLGEVGYLLGDKQQARACLEAFAKRYPGDALNAYTLAYLGQLALEQGDWNAAKDYFRRLLDEYPQSPLAVDCQFGLARALQKSDARDQASALFAKLAAEKSRFADDALFHLAAGRYADNQFAECITALDELESRFADSPLRSRASLLRGWSLFRLERFEEAAHVLKQIGDDKQVAAEAHYWLGLSCKRLKRWADSVAALEAGLAANPDKRLAPAMRFHLGEALLALQKYAEADAQFSQVLASNTAGDWADDCLLGRARVALAQNNLALVQSIAGQYEENFPDHALRAEFQRTVAKAFLNAGQYEQAIEILQELAGTEQPPAAARDQCLLAAALERAGKYRESLRILDRLSDCDLADVRARADLTRGLALAGLERHEEALAALEGYLRAEPCGPFAALALAESAICQLRLNHVEQAQQAYERLRREHAQDPILPAATGRLADLALAGNQLALAQTLSGELAASAEPNSAARGLFGQARIACRQRQWREAADKLAALLERFPNAPQAAEALLLSAAALEQLEEYDAAAERYAEVMAKHAQSPAAASALLAAARLHRQRRQTQEAAALYRQALADEQTKIPRDTALYELAWLLRDMGQTEEAARLFQRIHDEFATSQFWADATYRLAEQQRAAGKLDSAMELATTLSNSPAGRPLRIFALYLRGQVAAEKQEWATVVEAMKTLLDDYPDNELATQAEFWLAEALYRQNKLDQAQERFNRLAEKTDGQQGHWLAVVALRQAQILARNRDWQGAYRIAAEIADRYPGFKQQYEVDYLLGRCLANDARFDEARQAYRRVTESADGAKTETAAMSQWMIGESYFHQKNFQAAVKEYLRVEILYAFPTWQAAALLQAGKCYELMHEPEQAIELYRRLLATYPQTRFVDEASRRLRLAQQNSNSKKS